VHIVTTLASLLKWAAIAGLLAGAVWLWRAIDPLPLRILVALLWLLAGVAVMQLGAWMIVGLLIVLAARDAGRTDRQRHTSAKRTDEHATTSPEGEG